jgi:Uma2 family endonuclease
MSAHPSPATPGLVSVAGYLAGEADSPTKHEYLGGVIYAMAGASNRHNLIASNFAGILHSALRGKPCRVYNSDTKVRIQSSTSTRFYYPDGLVVCQPNPPEDSFQDQPAVIAEVLSDATRRTDETEKRDAYLTLPSLQTLLLIDPQLPGVLLYRRADQGFTRKHHSDLDAIIPLPEIDAELPLGELYEGLETA